MGKRKAHYTLSLLKRHIQNGEYRVTWTALRSAANDFGLFDAAQVAELILSLEDSDFFKSMTTRFDSTLWQDVYRPSVNGLPAYVKVQIVDTTTVVISFKTLEDE